MSNEYALKFAREAYEDAVRKGDVPQIELDRLKAEYNRQRRIDGARRDAFNRRFA